MRAAYSKRRSISTSLVAPPALSLSAFLICVSAVLIPPDYYRSLIMEQDLMFLNISIIGMFTAYWLVFMVGYYQGSKIKLKFNRHYFHQPRFKKSAVMALTVLLGIEVIIFIYSFNILYHRVPDLFINFMTDNVERTKEALMVQGTSDSFTSIVPISNGTLWWIVFRWDAIMISIQNIWRYCFLYIVLPLFIFVILSYSFLLGARFEIIPLLFGLMIIFFLKKKASGRKMRFEDWIFFLLFPLSIVAVFSVFSILRGASGQTGILYTLVGYGPASYNRLAAILNGSLSYDGLYGFLNEFEFFFHFPLEFRIAF